MSNSWRLVLASSSPYRKALLERLGMPFEVASPDIDESRLPGEAPGAYVERLAAAKARTVGAGRTGALVIGSDQTAVHGDGIVGKPSSHEDAVKQLLEASGRTISLLTGVALLNTDTGRIQVDTVPYSVRFRVLDRELVERYLVREKPYNCTGSLRAEGLGIALLEKFEGDDPNALIGLPLIRLVDMLRNEDVEVP